MRRQRQGGHNELCAHRQGDIHRHGSTLVQFYIQRESCRAFPDNLIISPSPLPIYLFTNYLHLNTQSYNPASLSTTLTNIIKRKKEEHVLTQSVAVDLDDAREHGSHETLRLRLESSSTALLDRGHDLTAEWTKWIVGLR